jgi:hypothetical protein
VGHGSVVHRPNHGTEVDLRSWQRAQRSGYLGCRCQLFKQKCRHSTTQSADREPSNCIRLQSWDAFSFSVPLIIIPSGDDFRTLLLRNLLPPTHFCEYNCRGSVRPDNYCLSGSAWFAVYKLEVNASMLSSRPSNNHSNYLDSQPDSRKYEVHRSHRYRCPCSVRFGAL